MKTIATAPGGRVIWPPNAESNPAFKLNRVVLPIPDGPIKAARSPAASSKAMSASTGAAPNCLAVTATRSPLIAATVRPVAATD